MARVAFADLLFSWPANGGADVDLFHVAQGLQARGHAVRVFGVHTRGSTERGRFEAGALPFPATRLSFAPDSFTPERVGAEMAAAVDAFAPHVVFVTHGYAFKTALLRALAHHTTVARYYAHEHACLRDPWRFLAGAPCPLAFYRTPDFCRRCALEGEATQLRHGQRNSWLEEWTGARAYAPAYPAEAVAAMRTADRVVVSNRELADDLAPVHGQVRVVPGGVPQPEAEAAPARERGPLTIFAPGRMDDPRKGLGVLLDACAQLAQTRHDFRVEATHFDVTCSHGWFRALGWLSHAATLEACQASDIVVAPSIWAEPFGLVALEGMRAGKPVCASAIGGLRDTVLHETTGLLSPAGDAAALAANLARLLDDAPLRARLGAAGRARVAAHFTWDAIIGAHYEPLIEELTR